MNYFIYSLKSSIADLLRNKGRTLLTSLGIFIGVLSVVLLTAFGLGLKLYIEQQFEALGSNLLRILPGKVIQEDGNFREPGFSFGSIKFEDEDVQSLKKVDGVKEVVPIFSKATTLVAGSERHFADIYTTSEGVFSALNVEVEYGRLFTSRDVDKRSKVVVVGPKIATQLYRSKQLALGKKLKVEGYTFEIIGVTKVKGAGFGGLDIDNFVFLPYTTGYVFNKDKSFITMVVQAEDEDQLKQVRDDVKNDMLERYDEDDFSIVEQDDLLGAITSIFSMLNLGLVAIASISLLVGGIGIMNIMYVTVTERIKEIGIRRALGAQKRDILIQFLIQSVVLSLFGGFAGLVTSYAIVALIQQYFPAYINLPSVFLALGVSTGIGILFGVFPAREAANLSPMEAIRYE